MIKNLPTLLVTLAASIAVVTPAAGQALQVSATVNGTASPITPGAAVALTATAIGQPVLSTVTVSYAGSSTANITGFSFTGSNNIALVAPPVFPVVLNPGGSATFTVQFLPSSGVGVTSLASIAFTENAQPSNFTFNVTGSAPDLAFTMFFAPNGTLANLTAGETISFPSTNLGSSTTAVINVLNRGSAPGSLQSVSLTGADFQVSGSPAPATVLSGQQVSFNVVFTPHAAGTTSGLLTVGLNNTNVVFLLAGLGASPSLSVLYRFADNNTHTLTDGSTISFPSVDVNGSSTASFDVVNQGTGTGTITAISVSGAGFQLSGAPQLPSTIPAGQDVRFAVVFTPTQPGAATGTFRITLNGTTITGTLSASTNPSSLSVSYALSDGNSRPLADGGFIAFPSVDANASTTASISIVNQGTGVGTVSSISVAGTGFQLTGLPVLPATIPAGQAIRFSVVFTPTQAGPYTGTFRVVLNGSSLSATLSGSTSPSSLITSYALSDGNARPLSDGTTIAFSPVDVNTSATATITIANQGSGTGTVTGISVAGTGFQLTGSPILPATIGANQSLKFGIVFNSAQAGSFTGTFRIDLTGRSISGTLSASTTSPNFTVSYALTDGIVHPISDATAITFPSVDVNATSTAQVTILNQGPGTGTVTGISVAGTGFQLSGAVQVPATVASGQSVRFNIVFAPTRSGSFTGTFRVDMTGRSISGTLSATTAASNFTLNYVDPDTTNVLPLPNGSTLPFPNTLTGTTAVINLLAINSGAGTGAINSITLGSTNSAFQLLNLPTLPVSVPPSQQLRFGIRFNPQAQQSSTDTLRIDFNGQITTVTLQGQATQPQYSYAFSGSSGAITVNAGGTAALADTQVGQTTSVTFSVLNFGTGDGQIANIGITGQGLTLTDLPALPLTLHPNGSQHFTVNFTPTQPGAVSGRLTIGSDIFTVTGTGIGSRLVYTYTSASSAVPVTDGGTVIFPPLAVGSTESLNFSVQNTGTSAATISSINLASASTIFTLSQLPGLPMNLDPGATITFPIGFVPNNTGSLTAVLRVNNSSFSLSGNGTQPTLLPSYSFQGPSGNQQPAQQSAIGLKLSAPYPAALQGTLKLTFVSSVFTDDSSIQFASGGRTVNFTIPANTTQALFTGNATSMAIQTGTTAGTILITPSFAMQSGFDLTPATPDVLNLTVQRLAPQLLNASISGQTLTSFTVALNGYSTTRGIRQLDIQVTPKAGQNFSVTHLTIDVSSTSAAWFQSTASQGFGGSFLVAIPFTLSNGSATDDVVRLLQSLSITATNDVGASNAITVNIP